MRLNFEPNLTRLLRYVDQSNKQGCWPWSGHVVKGYGRFNFRLNKNNYKSVGAHRAIYELLVGPIPETLVIDHLCRNPICMNPAHMEPVTTKENVLRGTGPTARNARKTHCSSGHKYTLENTLKIKNGKTCKVCKRERNRVWMQTYKKPKNSS